MSAQKQEQSLAMESVSSIQATTSYKLLPRKQSYPVMNQERIRRIILLIVLPTEFWKTIWLLVGIEKQNHNNDNDSEI
jgi:hypothetical protein